MYQDLAIRVKNQVLTKENFNIFFHLNVNFIIYIGSLGRLNI
jgi:hypothetical protein